MSDTKELRELEEDKIGCLFDEIAQICLSDMQYNEDYDKIFFKDYSRCNNEAMPIIEKALAQQKQEGEKIGIDIAINYFCGEPTNDGNLYNDTSFFAHTKEEGIKYILAFKDRLTDSDSNKLAGNGAGGAPEKQQVAVASPSEKSDGITQTATSELSSRGLSKKEVVEEKEE